MVKFRQNFNKKESRSNVDGFIPSGSAGSGDIRKKFRHNYSPSQEPINQNSIEDISAQPDGFYNSAAAKPLDEQFSESTQDSVEDFQVEDALVSGLAVNFEDEVPKKKRFRFFKKRDKPKKSLVKRLTRVVGVFFLLLIIGSGSILGYGYLKTRQIFRGNGDGAAALEKNVDPSKLNGEGDGRINVLLLGKGGPGHEAPDLTDTLLLASIDPVHNEAALLSVPRDLYIEDPSGNSSKINAVYANAKQYKLSQGSGSAADEYAAEDVGLKAIKDTVSDVLGVPIHYYVMVDFNAFKESIDTVGGVTIDVKEPLYDATMAWLNNGNALLADKGLQTFNGERALYYARSRYGSARGDFDRTERQREVIVALQQKVLSLGTFSNPFKVVELLTTLGNNVRTDLNGTDELKRMYEIAQKITPDKFTSVGLADPPNVFVTTDSIDSQSVVVPIAGLYQYEEIQSYVRNTLRDAFLRQENSRVVILNGTATPGLASVREKELRSYGYNIVSVDNAPTDDYVETVLIDLNSAQNPYTASYLQKRLKTVKSSKVIEGLPTAETADFVIILGSNETFEATTN